MRVSVACSSASVTGRRLDPSLFMGGVLRYLFANRRANRMKVLVHDGIGVWLAARRLNSGKFVWPREGALTATLNQSQFDALVLGLPWQRLGDGGVITVI